MPSTARPRATVTSRQRYWKAGMLWYAALTYVVLLSACSSRQDLIVLLPEEDGRVGTVTIVGAQRTTILDTPRGAATIDTKGRVKKDTLSEGDIQRTFAEALATQPPKALSFTLYFFEKSTDIVPASRATLAALLTEVARRQAVEVQITGHTDRVGKVPDNDRLSTERAEAVRDVLMQHGLHANFVRTVGRGEREPLIPTPDEQDEPRNRRVEVIVR